MLKRILLIPSLLIGSIALSGSFFETSVKGDGIYKKESRSVSDFNQIVSTSAINLRITCQKSKKVEIEGDSNIISLLKTGSTNNVLTISSDKALKPKLPLNVYISVKDINKLNISGSSKVYVDNIKNNDFFVSMSGAGNLNATGQTKNVDLEVSGAGYIDTKKLKSDIAKVELSGASMVDVYANQELTANISGFGKINYFGSPKKINKNISGMGIINERK